MKVDIKWQYISKEETLRAFDTDEFSGLDGKSVSRRRNKFGDNFIWQIRGSVFVGTLVKYIFDLPVIFFITAVLVAAFNGFSPLSAVICVVTFLSFVCRFLCEFAYRHLMSEAKKEVIPEVRVIRGGGVSIVSAAELVPGDIVLLSKGDAVPADVRIIYAEDLSVSEVSIGGEKIPVRLSSDSIPKGRKGDYVGNIALAGSFVVQGRGKAVCVACGDRTYAAENSISLVKGNKRDTETVVKAEKLSAITSALLLAVSLICFFVGIFAFKGVNPISDIFMSTFAFASSGVGAVCVSVVYYHCFVKAHKLKKSGATVVDFGYEDSSFVNKTVVVNDTATLKSGKTVVAGVYFEGKMFSADDLSEGDACDRLLGLLLMSYGMVPGQPAPMGKAIDDDCLQIMAAYGDHYYRTRGNSEISRSASTLVGFAPKSAENPCNTSLVSENGEISCVCSGDIGTVLSMCSSVTYSDYDEILSERKKNNLIVAANKYLSAGMRVIAISRRIAPVADLSRIAILQNSMSFVGFVVIDTPLMDGISHFFESLNSSGIGSVIFASQETDVSLISSVDGFDGETVYVSGPSDLNKVNIQASKNYILRLPEDPAVSPKIKYFLMQKLKKKEISATYISSESDDAAALSEGGCKICVRGVSSYDALPAVLVSSADVIVSRRKDLVSAVSAVFASNNFGKMYDMVKKYLLISLSLRFLFLIVSIFTQILVSPLIFLIWGLAVDQTVCFIIIQRGKS